MSDSSTRSVALWLGITAAFMVFVDSTIVNVALPAFTEQLGASRADLEWSMNAYTLMFAAAMLGAGASADRIGAKRVFLLGLALFTVMSAGCAVSRSMLSLNVCRLIQGGGAALMLPSALTLATQEVRNEQDRHHLVGLWAAAGGLGLAVGPLLGGVLVHLFGWPSIFWVNVIVGIVALLVGVRRIRPVPGHGRRLDLAGQATATAAIGGVVFALVEGPSRGWNDPAVLGAGVVAVAAIVGFVVAERRATAPLLPPKLYKSRLFIGSGMQGALFNFTFYGLLFSLSLLLQVALHLSPLEAGLSFLPLTGLVAVGNLAAPRIARRHGRPIVLLLGQALLALALLAIAAAGASGHTPWLLASLVPAGFGSGLLVPTMTSQTLAVVEPALHGAASAAFNTFRQLGGALGVATFGPLIAGVSDIPSGFAISIVVAAAATLAAAVLTVLTQRSHVANPAPAEVS